MKKHILITGLHSYVGNSLKDYLIKNDYPVKISMISVRNYEYRRLDYSDIDCIVHVAGLVHQSKSKSYEDYYRINVELTRDLASVAKLSNVKHFVYISSMSVYGDKVEVITNKTQTNPSSYYGITKLEAENELEKLKDQYFKISIIRPPMIYGKGCPGNYRRLSNFVRIIPISPTIDNQRSMIYIDNLSEFIWNLVIENKDGIFHPQNIEYVNTHELVEEIAKCHRKKIYNIKYFNSIIKKNIKHINLLNKVYGSLVYAKDMSILEGISYQKFDLIQSIRETEK